MGLAVAVAVLAAIAFLFVLDPGGVIAESGVPDLGGMGWRQLTGWGFRTVGVVVAQLVTIVMGLWPEYRPPKATPWYSGIPRPGWMPAAAVSALRGHMVVGRTMLASIIEMCQRGTLRIEAVGTRVGFLYRLSRQGSTQYEWERTICASLPPRATTIDDLDEAIRERGDVIGDGIGDYLQQRGLFHNNPVRVRRANSDDGSSWWLVASILVGVGSGFWAALWLDPWWANVGIGVLAGLVYSFVTLPKIRTGMLAPTQAGAVEIGRWLGLEETLAGWGSVGSRGQSDPMLAYAVALDVAQPWLDPAAPAPSWFGPGEDSSPRGADLDAAYHAFMHAPEWWLTGRSDDAAKAAAQYGHQEELQLLEQLEQLDREPSNSGRPSRRETAEDVEATESEPESQSHHPPHTTKGSPTKTEYQPHTREVAVEEDKVGGRLRGCLLRVAGLLSIGVLVLLILFSLDVVSPRDKPCPLNSPPIPTSAQIATIRDLIRNECVTVKGTIVSQNPGQLVIDIDRGEFPQRVNIQDPAEALQAIRSDRVVTLAGWLRVEEDGTYTVHFIPDHGPDREWWRNLLENIKGLF